jgi:2-polyprenyl-6-hydroxyphenyl methylase/3-demethylubiquinone-9 3-methyltransferase
MPVGTTIRGYLGPFERRAAEAYRSWFVDLDELAIDIASLGPFASILEIGAGDGVLAEALLEHSPEAELLGIDIAAEPGRLVDHPRATFRQVSTGELLANEASRYDLVVLSDVIHHVPAEARVQLLADAGRLTQDDGTLVVKDWERNAGAVHHVADFADRRISGDRGVSFLSREELFGLVEQALPAWSVQSEFRVPPRRNNLVLILRRR